MHQYKRWVVYTASFFLVISAALVNSPHMYYMAGILLALPAISYGIGMFNLRNLAFSRETPISGWDGETVEFHVVVHSRARTARLALQAQDHLPEWICPESEEPILFNAPPGVVSRVPYRVQLLKRGAYRLEWITITAQDPLGMYAFTRRYRAESEILVYPVPEPIPDVVLSGAERFGFRELPIAAARGSGVDPDGVREYVPGDPLRRMHWKSTARTGRLNVIEFEESRAVNVVIALDVYQGAHTGEGRESTFERLVRVAASLAQTAIRQGAAVRLVTDDAPDAAAVTGRGSDHLYTVLSGLARAEPRDSQRMSASLVRRVGALDPGTTLVVLTSGADSELGRALTHFSGGGAQVVVVYADPPSMHTETRVPSSMARRALIESFLAANAAPFVLPAGESGALNLEPVTDVRYYQ